MATDLPIAGRYNRRQFLSRLGWLSTGAGLLAHSLAEAQSPPDVVIARGGEVEDRLAAALRPFGGMEHFVQPGMTVVIKPNAAFGEPPETGANTTPEVVGAVIRACRKTGASRVIVAEHCLSSRGLFGTENDLSGITQVARTAGAELINTGFDDRHYRPFQIDAPDHPTHPISRYLLEADVVINLPRLKTHPYAGYTLSIKNLMGTMRQPGAFHRDNWRKLPERLSCLGRALQPHIALAIIDATHRVEGWAAGQPGKLTRLDTLIAGTNMVSVDAIGLTFFGKNPLSEWNCSTRGNYLRVAHEAGWGTADLREIRLKQIQL